MRTTVNLPPSLHQRAIALAKARGVSQSAMVAELDARGLSQLDEPLRISTDPTSGFPVVNVGRRVSSAEVEAADSIYYGDVDLDRVRGHRQVTDAYLVGLARSHDGVLATLDQGIAAAYEDSVALLPHETA